MKLYRIVPDTFNLRLKDEKNSILSKLNFYNFEELYYELGYTSFLQNEELHGKLKTNYYSKANTFNSIYKGKFFFLYPEFAIKTASQIMNTKGLSCCNYILIEYDFPIELISKYIGIGYYHIGNYYYKNLIEFFIPDKEFGTYEQNVLSNITKEERNSIFYKYLNESIENLKISLSNSRCINGNIESIQYMLQKYEELLYVSSFEGKLENSELYQAYITNDKYLIKSPYITGNSCFINENTIYSILKNEITIQDLFFIMNFDTDNIKVPNKEYDEELFYEIINGKNKEKILSLLNK